MYQKRKETIDDYMGEMGTDRSLLSNWDFWTLLFGKLVRICFSWTLVKFFLNRWSQSSLEKLHMLWNMKRPLWQLLPFNLLPLNLISSLALLVVNCPLGLRFLDTLSIYKNKIFKPVIALWISLFDQITLFWGKSTLFTSKFIVVLALSLNHHASCRRHISIVPTKINFRSLYTNLEDTNSSYMFLTYGTLIWHLMSLWLDSGSHVVVATLNTTIASSNKSGPGI